MRILEVCAGDLTSAQAAAQGGAQRIELCSALQLDGLTPSAETIEGARRIEGLKLHVLIRPREGDFVYDLDGKPVCLSQGCVNLFLEVCADSHVRPQVLSISTTKLSAMTWAKEDAGITIVPAELEEVGDEDLVRKIIMDERLYMEKTLSVVKGRPLSNVAETFLSHFHAEI